MAINLGTNSVSAIKLGSTTIDKVYLGSNQVYPSSAPITIRAVKFTSANAQTLGINSSVLGSITPTFEYSTDGGSTWSSWNVANAISFGSGTDLYLRGMNTFLAKPSSNYVNFVFSTSSPVYCSGNIMHLFDYTQDLTAFPDDSQNSSRGIKHMFENCSALVTAPDLPATNLLVDWCYQSTFQNCTSLTTAPALPALSVPQNGYDAMFASCTSLQTPPALPATTIGNSAYIYMFHSCTGLTSIPALPATTVGDFCYTQMFLSCSQIYMIDSLAPYQDYVNEFRFGTSNLSGKTNNMFALTGNSVSGSVVTPTSQVLYTKNTIIT